MRTIGVGGTCTNCMPVSPSTYPDAIQVAAPCRKRLPPVPVSVTSNGCEVPSQTAGSRKPNAATVPLGWC
jgi:hypothetical protein